MSAAEQPSETPSERPSIPNSNSNSNSSQSSEESPANASSANASPAMADTLCYAFEKLSTGSDEVQITFQGQIYRLRKTRNGRLIMTK